MEDELFFYLELLSRVRATYNKVNQLADFKLTVNFKNFYWHKNENVNKLAPNIPLKWIYSVTKKLFYPSLLFLPLLPTFLGVGGLADNSHKSSDLGKKLVNI